MASGHRILQRSHCKTACDGTSTRAEQQRWPNVQVIDLISLKPFDLEAITKSIKKTRKCIIVEECMKTGGIGASLSAVINESLFNELDHEVGCHLHVFTVE